MNKNEQQKNLTAVNSNNGYIIVLKGFKIIPHTSTHNKKWNYLLDYNYYEESKLSAALFGGYYKQTKNIGMM